MIARILGCFLELLDNSFGCWDIRISHTEIGDVFAGSTGFHLQIVHDGKDVWGETLYPAKLHRITLVVRVVQIGSRAIPPRNVLKYEPVVLKMRVYAHDTPVPESTDPSRTFVVVPEGFGADPSDRSSMADDHDSSVGMVVDDSSQRDQSAFAYLLGSLTPRPGVVMTSRPPEIRPQR